MLPHIKLVMIVGNEEQYIADCIKSALPFIDSYCIIHTQFDDNTEEVAKEVLGDLPGEWLDQEWVHDGFNRTRLFEIARTSIVCDYYLCLDADERIVGDPVDLPELIEDSYYCYFNNPDFTYARHRFIKATLPWIHEGTAHSALSCGELQWTRATLDMSKIAILDAGTNKDRTTKFLRDYQLLADDREKNPHNSRTVFYLAQTCRCLQKWDEAIKYYRERVELGGWPEEVFYAQYMLGRLIIEQVDYEEGAAELLKAYKMRPTRNEPLRKLAAATTTVADRMPMPTDRLFLQPQDYEAQIPERVLPYGTLPDNLPIGDSWALPIDALAILTSLVEENQPQHIFECGSGISTILFAELVEKYDGFVTSLEHEEEFYGVTHDRLLERGLENPLVLAPLYNSWYSINLDVIGGIDFLLVDGPPNISGPLSRFPAMPILHDYLNDGAIIALDDYQRADENYIFNRWLKAYPQMTDPFYVKHRNGQMAFATWRVDK